MKLRIAGLAFAGLAPALSAQATFATDTVTAFRTVVVQDASIGGGIDNPLYLPPATDNNYSGVVNLWFRDAAGTVRSACTGALLTTRKILSAAHCVSTNTASVRWASFTARFRNADGTFSEVNGTGFAVQQNYSGAVVEEQDVAVLTLSADAPSSARRYSLFSGNPMVEFTMAGFGRTGDGLTGDNNTANNQFGTANVLRAGRNRFETTGRDGGSYATIANPDPGAFGGVLRADMDGPVELPTTFMCGTLGFCDRGLGLNETAVGRGDSGGAALTSTWQVLGVASWGQSTGGGNLGQYGTSFGYACVANYAPNAACVANYNFVLEQVAGVIPEPSTYALMATGLVALVGIGRRRNTRNN